MADVFEEIGVSVVAYLRELTKTDPGECLRLAKELAARLTNGTSDAETMLANIATDAAGQPISRLQ